MNLEFGKQVNKEHYTFEKYFYKGRWMSSYYQLKEILDVADVRNVLEIGPGTSLIKSILAEHRPSLDYKSLDIANDLQPDYLGSVTSIPLEDKSFDIVCAFQVLEHVPYEKFVKSLKEMKRVARKKVIFSVPHTAAELSFQLKIPFLNRAQFFLRIPFPVKHKFDGQHFWEVGKRGYLPTKIRKDVMTIARVDKEYVPFENQYHRFYVLTVD